MENKRYQIRSMCCDWALDIPLGDTTVVLHFNSRNNAELVKDILEHEDSHPNEAVPFQTKSLGKPLTIEQLLKMEGYRVLLYRMRSTEPLELGTVKQNGDVLLDNGVSAYHELYLSTWVAFTCSQSSTNTDYKEVVERLKKMLPPKIPYGELVGAPWPYTGQGEMVYEEPESYFIEQAITAITDLLARVEAAEARAEKAEREKNAAVNDLRIFGHCCSCYKWFNAPNCKAKEPCGTNDNWEWRGLKED